MKLSNLINILILGLMGCVSSAKYNYKVNEIDELNKQKRKLRKEIRYIQKENIALTDSFKKLRSLFETEAQSLVRRLAEHGIAVNIKQKELEPLRFETSTLTERYYNAKMGHYPNRDTNYARKTSWLSQDEKAMYYYLNYARTQPQEFCKKFLMPKLKYNKNNAYFITLIDYLMEMKPRNALIPDREQYENAKCHAKISGKKGYVGHNRQSKTCKKQFRGECCAYGSNDPLGVVVQLLVDSGVPSLGHRYICLGWYKTVGIAKAPHKSYGHNVVMDFR